MSRLLLLLPAAVSALTAGVMRAPAAAVARTAPLTMQAAAPAPAKVKVRHAKQKTFPPLRFACARVRDGWL